MLWSKVGRGCSRSSGRHLNHDDRAHHRLGRRAIVQYLLRATERSVQAVRCHFCSRFMGDPSDVVLERERPIGCVDLPLALFAEGRPEPLESFRSEIAAKLDTIGFVGPSNERSERWEITEPYRGIEHAQLVVINIRGDAERRRGERAWEDIQRLRKDTQVFEDIFGLRSSRVPIKAIVADLNNERDPGLKEAVRRVLRAFDRNGGVGEHDRGATATTGSPRAQTPSASRRAAT